MAPAPPRVSDIVAEAGSSNKAFYRYFAGKDDVILAVMERGVAIVVSYLQHQMAKEPTPAARVQRWIEGALAQVADPHLISMSRAAAGQISATTDWRAADEEITRPMRDLLAGSVAAAVIAISSPTRSAMVRSPLRSLTKRGPVPEIAPWSGSDGLVTMESAPL